MGQHRKEYAVTERYCEWCGEVYATSSNRSKYCLDCKVEKLEHKKKKEKSE